MAQIWDLQRHQFVDVEPEKCEATHVLLNTVLVSVKDSRDGTPCETLYQFWIGDAVLAGIPMPEDKTLSEFVEGEKE